MKLTDFVHNKKDPTGDIRTRFNPETNQVLFLQGGEVINKMDRESFEKEYEGPFQTDAAGRIFKQVIPLRYCKHTKETNLTIEKIDEPTEARYNICLNCGKQTGEIK